MTDQVDRITVWNVIIVLETLLVERTSGGTTIHSDRTPLQVRLQKESAFTSASDAA